MFKSLLSCFDVGSRMSLRIQLRELWRQTETASGISHQSRVFLAHQSGPVPAMVLQKFTERKDTIFPQQQTNLSVSSNGPAGATTAGSLIGLLYNAQIEAARCLAGLGIVPHRRFAGEIGADDPRRCRRGVVAMTFLIDVLGRRQLLHFINRGLTEKRHILAGDSFSANEDLLSARFLNDAHV
jgi:hypothetical protein